MRIDRFDLLAYGAFTDTSIDLSAGSAGLHLIYGDNEAGKSTSLRGLVALLFGIATRTTDNYLHSNPQLRLGGKLRLTSGEELEFIRRKGIKNTLLAPGSEKPLDDLLLAPYLPGSMTEELFTTLYGIDHARLISGGRELLNQSGDLGQALFSAAVGTSNLRQVLTELQDGADELYKPRASTRPMNRAIADYKNSLKKTREASLPVSEWQRLQKASGENLSAIENIDGEIEKRSKEKSRLDRLNRVKGVLSERRALIAREKELSGILLLAEDFDERRKAALSSLHNSTETKARAMARMATLKKDAENLVVRQELLDNEEVILTIYRELGAVETALKDRPGQEGKRQQLRDEAEKLLKSIAPHIGLENGELLRPLLTRKKLVATLATRHDLLLQKKETARAALAELQDEHQEISRELGGKADSPLDLPPLRAVVASARKAGDLEGRLAEKRKQAEAEETACEAERSRLGRFSGTARKLCLLSMPLPETLDIFDKRFQELEQRIRDEERALVDVTKQKRQAERDLQTLLRQGDIPSLIELESARHSRDRGWDLIKRKYIQELDVREELRAFSADSAPASVFEQRVKVADDLSDQLRSAADQVVKRGELEARINDLDSLLLDLSNRLEKAQGIGSELELAWQGVWQPLTVAPGSPREMKQWLLRVEKLLAHVAAVDSLLRDVQQLETDNSTLRRVLAEQIGLFGDNTELEEKSLETLISLCEQTIAEVEETRLQRAQLSKTLAETELRILRVNQELQRIDSDHTKWTANWIRAIDGLNLEADVHPHQAMESFERLADFFASYDRSEELRRRIYGIDRVVEKFAEKVLNFTASIGYDDDQRPAATLAAQLNRQLNEARETRVSHEKIRLQGKDIADDISEADIGIESAQQQLTLLIQQAGVTKDEELELAAENSRRKRDLQGRLEALEQELSRNGDGLSIAELEAEAEGADIDGLDSALEKVNVALKELQQTRDQLRDHRQTLQNEIKSRDGSGRAARAAEEAEQQLADIGRGAEQYLRLQIASLILEQKIEAYRKKNQGPVLAKASLLFSRLTLSSYTGLRDELDSSNRPVLFGIRADNREVGVDQMSEGTRDQLYLSLRLATLEQHLAAGEPMPLIVDDILIGFDDNRTAACLEVLSELALHTQVLLFTHHRRVMELAGGLKARAGIFTHELARNSVSN